MTYIQVNCFDDLRSYLYRSGQDVRATLVKMKKSRKNQKLRPCHVWVRKDFMMYCITYIYNIYLYNMIYVSICTAKCQDVENVPFHLRKAVPLHLVEAVFSALWLLLWRHAF